MSCSKNCCNIIFAGFRLEDPALEGLVKDALSCYVMKPRQSSLLDEILNGWILQCWNSKLWWWWPEHYSQTTCAAQPDLSPEFNGSSFQVYHLASFDSAQCELLIPFKCSHCSVNRCFTGDPCGRLEVEFDHASSRSLWPVISVSLQGSLCHFFSTTEQRINCTGTSSKSNIILHWCSIDCSNYIN